VKIKTCIVQRDLCNRDVDTTFYTVSSLNTSTDEKRVGLSYPRSLLKTIANFYLKSFFFLSFFF